MAAQEQSSLLEIGTIVILGLAALLTAWSSFQSSLWDGEALDSYAIGDLQQGESAVLRENALAVYVAEQALFLEYAKATRGEDPGLAMFIRTELMSPRLRNSLDVWQDLPVSQRENTPLSAAYGYSVPGREEAGKRSDDARATVASAREADNTGDGFNLATVLFAGSLFLAGLSSTVRFPRFRLVLLAMGSLMLVSTWAWLMTLRVASPF